MIRALRLARNLKWWLTPASSDLELVFVVGAPRSGTTLVQRVICSHPGFHSTPGESGLFTLQDVFDPSRKHFAIDAPLRERLLVESRSHVEFLDRAVRSLDATAQGRVFVEKTPQHALRTRWLLSRFPRARVINVVRDGRDCFCSSQRNEKVPQRSSAATFARYWRRCVNAARSKRHADRLFHLRYEDFVAEPAPWVEKMMAFLGTQSDPRQLDPAEVGKDRRAGLREFERLGAAIDGSSVAQWRSRLSEAECTAFRRIAGRELRRLGYDS